MSNSVRGFHQEVEASHRCLGQSTTIGSTQFYYVRNFIYLGFQVNYDKDVSAEKKRRIMLCKRIFGE